MEISSLLSMQLADPQDVFGKYRIVKFMVILLLVVQDQTIISLFAARLRRRQRQRHSVLMTTRPGVVVAVIMTGLATRLAPTDTVIELISWTRVRPRAMQQWAARRIILWCLMAACHALLGMFRWMYHH